MIDGEEKKPVDDDCGSGDTLGTCNYVHKTMTKGEFVLYSQMRAAVMSNWNETETNCSSWLLFQ